MIFRSLDLELDCRLVHPKHSSRNRVIGSIVLTIFLQANDKIMAFADREAIKKCHGLICYLFLLFTILALTIFYDVSILIDRNQPKIIERLPSQRG